MKIVIVIFLVALLAGCAIVPLDPFYYDGGYHGGGPGYHGNHHRHHGPQGYGYRGPDGWGGRWSR
ncbi:MAG: hypothetical protein A4E63_02451 [Syntrophorhabdus sp. PtaU1.Bin050]|nr:MAG: hypothetical protein A4E63_02451 [Syntrophorhabdus sp. PtaU1.Bin050]